MEFSVAQEVADIDAPVAGGDTVRSVLAWHLDDDRGGFLLSHTLACFDDEFDVFHGHIIHAKEQCTVLLDDRVQEIIQGIQAQSSLSDDQCAALLLDVVRTFIINGRRMMG